jgi:hypothetical protein
MASSAPIVLEKGINSAISSLLEKQGPITTPRHQLSALEKANAAMFTISAQRDAIQPQSKHLRANQSTKITTSILYVAHLKHLNLRATFWSLACYKHITMASQTSPSSKEAVSHSRFALMWPVSATPKPPFSPILTSTEHRRSSTSKASITISTSHTTST